MADHSVTTGSANLDAYSYVWNLIEHGPREPSNHEFRMACLELHNRIRVIEQVLKQRGSGSAASPASGPVPQTKLIGGELEKKP